MGGCWQDAGLVWRDSEEKSRPTWLG